MKNKYSFPIKLTDKVRVTYIDSRAHKGRLQHAVDFITKKGTPIMAALEGIVVDVKQDSNIGGDTKRFDRYGNYIEIAHKNGEYSIYEHIKKNGSLVKIGDPVKQGQPIGFSGATGWLAGLGPHLHFDVHKYFGKSPDDYRTLEILWE